MIAVVGAGAAGLATAIFAARRGAKGPIVVFDGARRPGAKILVSGGSRCNVTNAVVTERDFHGSPPHLVKRVLRAFGVGETVAFFREIGVALHEEEHGKLFPDANRSAVVLRALLDEAGRRGVTLRCGGASAGGRAGRRGLRPPHGPRGGAGRARGAGHGRALAAEDGQRRAGPADGRGPRPLGRADDAGARAARARRLLPRAALRHRPRGGARRPRRRAGWSSDARGSLLWTHFGVSGPVVLDVSRTWLRARLEGRAPTLEASLLPGREFGAVEAELVRLAALEPALTVARALARWLPAGVAEAVAARGRPRRHAARPPAARGAPGPRPRPRGRALPVVRQPRLRLRRGHRRRRPARRGRPAHDGVAPSCPGLFLVGEMLDVDGRIGGFNFQWAWSSGWVAAGGLARGAVIGSRAGKGADVPAYRYVVTGRVQGVGYRYFVLRQADALGVSGFARNLRRRVGRGPGRGQGRRARRLRGPAPRGAGVRRGDERRARGRRGARLGRLPHPVARSSGMDIEAQVGPAQGGHPRRARLPEGGHRLQGHHDAARDPVLFRRSLDLMTALCGDLAPDKVVAIESRGFILGGALADRLGAGFVPVRKPGRLPWKARRVSYELEYGRTSSRCTRTPSAPGSGSSWSTT